jgi:hypothetical protein
MRIDANAAGELRSWSREFGVTSDELRQAIDAVGDDASAVQAHLEASRQQRDSGRMSERI